MNVLLESPTAVGALGLLLITIAAIPFTQTRSRSAFAGLVLAIVLAVGGLALERWYQTPSERLLSAIDGLFADIEANDLAAVIARIDPQTGSQVRADAEVLMPMFQVESASEGGQVSVEIADSAAPNTTATASFKPMLKVQHKSSGAMGAYFDKLELDYVLRDGEWLISAYRPAKDWRAGAAKLGR